ncbi:MAG: phosphatase PAP2 family protein [Spirochaetaceae bacterium]|jgi:membrane-associated phospholipid phosphatase|nr:phosphatase PAP2 family protein [Spirochaetaceae bacterium]
MNIYAAGLSLIRSIQQYESPFLDTVMKGLSFLGSPVPYLVLVPLLFWCVDERRALRLALLLLFSAWLNSSLKMLFAQPRPYDLDPGVARAYEGGVSGRYGLPSGHAQTSLVLALGLASWKKKATVYVPALCVVFLISLSRLYLGVHFPTDILAGWFTGLLIFAADRLLFPLLAALLEAGGVRARLITLALLTFMMNSLHAWDPGPGGLLLGFGGGYVLMKSRFPFCAGLPVEQRAPGDSSGDAEIRRTPKRLRLALRYVFGMAGLCLLSIALKKLLPGEGSPYYALARFCRYGAAGFWVSAAAPAFFVRFSLARSG